MVVDIGQTRHDVVGGHYGGGQFDNDFETTAWGQPHDFEIQPRQSLRM